MIAKFGMNTIQRGSIIICLSGTKEFKNITPQAQVTPLNYFKKNFPAVINSESETPITHEIFNSLSRDV